MTLSTTWSRIALILSASFLSILALPSCDSDDPPGSGNGGDDGSGGDSGGGDSGDGLFSINVQFVGNPSELVRNVVLDAAQQWEDVVTGDLPDLDLSGFPIEAGACGIPHGTIDGEIDDLLLLVNADTIDGAEGAVGVGGPCVCRAGTDLVAVGIVTLDSDDVDRANDLGVLDLIVLHEMGHALGIGTLWPDSGFLQSPSDPENGGTAGSNSRFTGASAVAAFNAVGGSGASVPVENGEGFEEGSCGSGCVDGHWREASFGRELMTSALNAGATNPLSSVSIASLEDLGYQVDLTQADSYTFSADASIAKPTLAQPPIELGDDRHHGPMFHLGPNGERH